MDSGKKWAQLRASMAAFPAKDIGAWVRGAAMELSGVLMNEADKLKGQLSEARKVWSAEEAVKAQKVQNRRRRSQRVRPEDVQVSAVYVASVRRLVRRFYSFGWVMDVAFLHSPMCCHGIADLGFEWRGIDGCWFASFPPLSLLASNPHFAPPCFYVYLL